MSCDSCSAYEGILDTLCERETEQSMLCTVTELENYVCGTIDNDLAESSIKIASAKVERYLGRRLKFVEEVAEKVQSYGEPNIQLSRFPIYDIKCIEYDDCICPPCCACDQTFMFDECGDTGLLNTCCGFPWSAPLRKSGLTYNRRPGAECYSITVVYSGGYLLDGQTAPTFPAKGDCDCSVCLPDPINAVQSLPLEIKHAACVEAALIYNKLCASGNSNGPCDPNIKMVKLGEYTVQYFNPSERTMASGVMPTSGLSFEAQEMLKPYRIIPQW